jgi:hypothetical protein
MTLKTAYQALLAAFSMFSTIPVPKTEWNDHGTRYVMAPFPLSVPLSVWE